MKELNKVIRPNPAKKNAVEQVITLFEEIFKKK